MYKKNPTQKYKTKQKQTNNSFIYKMVFLGHLKKIKSPNLVKMAQRLGRVGWDAMPMM